ncbi:MAG: hypothetical protein P4L53_04760 [Candidatus Obscuribacterales bacterium]|nr:hypothetical protein [Candidatus Obscuribacterales bacterium]
MNVCYHIRVHTPRFSSDEQATDCESQQGLDWMIKARALLTELAGKKELPKNLLHFKLYNLDYGLAKAYYDLGQHGEAKRILKHALRLAPVLNTASLSTLRGVAQCSELLAQIHLDRLEDERHSKNEAN